MNGAGWHALILGGLIVLCGKPPAAAQVPAGGSAVRVGFLISGHDSLRAVEASAVRGALLGAREAARAAELLEGQFEVIADTAGDAESLVHTARRLIDEGRVFALVGGFDTASCTTLAGVAARSGILYVNVGCSSEALHEPDCRRTTFHIAPRAALRDDAGSPHAGAVLWHPSLVRYGARQLNQRFEEAFDRPMDGPAWASWFAVKVLWEAATRMRTTDASSLIRYLERDRARFDGHKGRALTFGARDHQLEQPLYVFHGGSDVHVEEIDAVGSGAHGRPCHVQPLPE